VSHIITMNTCIWCIW